VTHMWHVVVCTRPVALQPQLSLHRTKQQWSVMITGVNAIATVNLQRLNPSSNLFESASKGLQREACHAVDARHMVQHHAYFMQQDQQGQPSRWSTQLQHYQHAYLPVSIQNPSLSTDANHMWELQHAHMHVRG
jgi:hypothetical protein